MFVRPRLDPQMQRAVDFVQRLEANLARSLPRFRERNEKLRGICVGDQVVARGKHGTVMEVRGGERAPKWFRVELDSGETVLFEAQVVRKLKNQSHTDSR